MNIGKRNIRITSEWAFRFVLLTVNIIGPVIVAWMWVRMEEKFVKRAEHEALRAEIHRIVAESETRQFKTLDEYAKTHDHWNRTVNDNYNRELASINTELKRMSDRLDRVLEKR